MFNELLLNLYDSTGFAHEMITGRPLSSSEGATIETLVTHPCERHRQPTLPPKVWLAARTVVVGPSPSLFTPTSFLSSMVARAVVDLVWSGILGGTVEDWFMTHVYLDHWES